MMKKFILLIFIGLNFSLLNGQTLGFEICPNLTTTAFSSEPGFGFSSGLFFDQKIYKQLGIATGISYMQFIRPAMLFSWDESEFLTPDQLTNRFDIIEFPLLIAFNFIKNSESNWKIYAKSGYSYGQVFIRYVIINKDDEIEISEGSTLDGFPSHLHFFNFGFEVRRSISDRINLSLASQYKFAETDHHYDDWMHGFSASIKVGFSFEKTEYGELNI